MLDCIVVLFVMLLFISSLFNRVVLNMEINSIACKMNSCDPLEESRRMRDSLERIKQENSGV